MDGSKLIILASLIISNSVVEFTVPVACFGINYGRIADNLLHPADVVQRVKSIGATKVKIYDADHDVLAAFANSGLEITVGLGNEHLQGMQEQNAALDWVRANVQSFFPATKITCISVGNEVLAQNDSSRDYLLSAMKNVHSALVSLSMDKEVSVTTAHSLAILENSYPPSAGSFRPDLSSFLNSLLKFHQDAGSSFSVNLYPYFAYKDNPNVVSLNFVLFDASENLWVEDPNTKKNYENMFFMQIDAVVSALSSLGFKNIPIEISETGWPSKGDEGEAGANLENAQKYNSNLIKIVSEKKGTPLRPSCDFTTYLFALFNEDLKTGPTSERNYGLLQPDGTPVYSISSNSTQTSTYLPDGSFTGYLTISASPPQETQRQRTAFLFNLILCPLLFICWNFVLKS